MEKTAPEALAFGVVFSPGGAPGMGNNMVVEVRCAIGSRKKIIGRKKLLFSEMTEGWEI